MPPDPRLLEFARSPRRGPTPAGEATWRLFRNRQFAGFEFRRQHPVGIDSLDFCPNHAGFVVELDGGSHATGEGGEHDRARRECPEPLGLLVLRSGNTDVLENEDGVIDTCAATRARRRGRGRRRTPGADRRSRDRSAPSFPVGDRTDPPHVHPAPKGLLP